jgi:hypothetical protein
MSDNRAEVHAEVGFERALPPLPPSHALGDPMTIEEVAAFLGCSAWTVRQRYLPQGIPHLRACASGKLVFFREQVIGWILKRQQQRQKGGQLR